MILLKLLHALKLLCSVEFQLFKGVAEVLGHKGQLNLCSPSIEMYQDKLGNYLLHIIAKSYKIFTKSHNHEEYECAIFIHISLLESTAIILAEIPD